MYYVSSAYYTGPDAGSARGLAANNKEGVAIVTTQAISGGDGRALEIDQSVVHGEWIVTQRASCATKREAHKQVALMGFPVEYDADTPLAGQSMPTYCPRDEWCLVSTHTTPEGVLHYWQADEWLRPSTTRSDFPIWGSFSLGSGLRVWAETTDVQIAAAAAIIEGDAAKEGVGLSGPDAQEYLLQLRDELRSATTDEGSDS